MGPYFAHMDPGSLAGADYLTPTTARGKTDSHMKTAHTLRIIITFKPFNLLFQQVDNWNPLTDTVPIHSWIHPWLPLLQSRLEPLYPPIRSKLSNALQRWHPSDASARLILQPWKNVFTAGAWEAFLLKNIIPKLGSNQYYV